MAALPGLGGQLAGIAFDPYMGQPDCTVPRRKKAAGAQDIAGFFGNRLGFPCDKSFIGMGTAKNNDGIGTNLLTGGELHNVVPNQLFAGQ